MRPKRATAAKATALFAAIGEHERIPEDAIVLPEPEVKKLQLKRVRKVGSPKPKRPEPVFREDSEAEDYEPPTPEPASHNDYAYDPRGAPQITAGPLPRGRTVIAAPVNGRRRPHIAPMANIEDMPVEILRMTIEAVEMDKPTSTRTLLALCKAYPVFDKLLDEAYWQRHVLWKYRLKSKANTRELAAQMVLKECVGCSTVSGTRENFCLQIQLCDDCSRNDERFALITATRAKSEYKVNEKDLAELRCIQRRNPHYRSAAPMRLYAVQHVKAAGEAKMAAKNSTLETERAKSEKRKRAIADGKVAREAQRRSDLVVALAARGLGLRWDSRLCSEYIDGKSTWSIPAIVDRMEDMHVLHEHARYSHFQQQAYEDASEAMAEDRERYGVHEGFQYYYDTSTAEASALRELEAFEQSDKVPADAEVCACGRKLLQDFLDVQPPRSHVAP